MHSLILSCRGELMSILKKIIYMFVYFRNSLRSSGRFFLTAMSWSSPVYWRTFHNDFSPPSVGGKVKHECVYRAQLPGLPDGAGGELPPALRAGLLHRLPGEVVLWHELRYIHALLYICPQIFPQFTNLKSTIFVLCPQVQSPPIFHFSLKLFTFIWMVFLQII